MVADWLEQVGHGNRMVRAVSHKLINYQHTQQRILLLLWYTN